MSQHDSANISVAGIVLAAGSASRMGRPKQLLDWGGRPLVRVVVEAALTAPLEPIIVVVGHAGAAVKTALEELPVMIVENAHYLEGQSTSLRKGIASLPPTVDAALILLGDQPFINSKLIETIIAQWFTTQAPIVAPRYRGERGHPVLFARELFSALTTITGDQGARELLRTHIDRTAFVAIDDDRPLADIDTLEDYERLRDRA